MKEEDLTKAIQLKEQLDSERCLLKFVNHSSVDLRVNLEERCDHGHVINIDYLLDRMLSKDLERWLSPSSRRELMT